MEKQQWYINDDNLKLIYDLLEKYKHKTINFLEIGTGHGYSAIKIMQKMSELNIKGNFYTIEKDDIVQINQKFKGIKLHIITADATKYLNDNLELQENQKEINNIDLLFIDGMHRQYKQYFELCFDLMNADSYVIADNTISHKEKMLDFIDKVKEFNTTFYETEKGMTITHLNKTKYYLKQMNIEHDFVPENKLLLDVCCAPCSTHSIDVLLKDNQKITLFLSNHNVHPIEEYERRKTEQLKLADKYNLEIIEDEYNDKRWFDFIKGYENCKEHEKRCDLCFEYRFLLLLKYAYLNNFNKVTSTLTISPYKDSKTIFSIARKIFDPDIIEYLEYDFKKQDGYNHSIEKSKDMYRQDYCGCIYSRKRD